MYDHILIRYGELALKGKNQKTFLNQLVKNIKELIKSETGEEPLIETEQGRIFLKLNGQSPEKYYEPLKKAFGVLSFSPVRKTELDMEAMQKTALEEMLALDKKPATFRVTVRRPNKRFPVKSPQAQKNIGAFLLRNYSGLKVDLHSPDVEVFVEIRYDAAYVYTRKINGPGGLPLGTGGKAMLLYPGAGQSCSRLANHEAGVVIEAVHFTVIPIPAKELRKVLDLARVLAQFAGEIKVHIVPFTRIQESISENVDSLWITLMRRFMFRIAERIAEKRNALALVTGENIGQVASQTIESIYAINRVIHTPVLRPLITMDKEEIMNIARNINTYDISIRPYEDCCTVFLPKEPKTKPKLEACEKAEELLRVEELVQDAVQNTEVITIKGKAEDQFGYF